MKFGEITHFITGVAVPVSSLRTEESCGVGEFSDLIKLGVWCQKSGLDLIQILPVNDTGDEPSPYSARSAFALNPIFISLEKVEGANAFSDEIEAARERLNSEERINYPEIYNFKVDLLRKIYAAEKSKIKRNRNLKTWIDENGWLENYTLFCTLKDYNEQRSWQEWQALRDPVESEIKEYRESHKDEILFYAWVQFLLENQLKEASLKLGEMGIKLKGDIPILINEDSADVWGERSFFDMTFRAGAPPDMFSDKGQNWGFPCYNWENLKKDDYRWWKKRLKQASKFYHAYRIDHVLGFFRLWQISEDEVSGILGRFNPAVPISGQELESSGFHRDRIDAFLTPSYEEGALRNFFGPDADKVLNECFQKRDYDKFTLSDTVSNEKAIEALDMDEALKDKLLKLYWNRVLLPSVDDKSSYQPTWFFYKAGGFRNLSEDDQGKLRAIVDRNWEAQDGLWRKNGRDLLQMMCDTTDMLVCAEDLGAVPPCVPDVLNELKILGLRIERWTREYDKEGSPFINPGDYNRLTVCSPSGHDTSTLRQWWEEDNWDRHNYFSLLNMGSDCPDSLSSELSLSIIKRNLMSNSLLTIFPIYDLLGLYYNLRSTSPEDERINTPGTISEKNWSYRMKDKLEFLIDYTEYNNYLKSIIEERRSRPMVS